ncbi:meiosis-specific topoisomerase spo11 [Curvularia clavata]|uniref:DNA topoisomerase (ATP-hydrolyzing) n=1 Tax=Curvularia clavata TaxID=95742 RepID=A0A9Q8YZN2_CURCL|nr:meiosis-specific topoisomerase spo11 [Curvularia clavata]
MDEDDFEDLLFGDLGTQPGPSDLLLDDSDDDILFSDYKQYLRDCELADTTGATFTIAGVPHGLHPLAESTTSAYEQPIHQLTDVTPNSVCDRYRVIALIEAMLERIIDCLLRGDQSLTITLKSRAALSRRNTVGVEGNGSIPKPKEREIKFPGANPQEAWNFTVLLRILELIHGGLIDDTIMTKRDVYYRHPDLFVKQSVVDRYVDDLACTFGITRSQLNVTAAAKGLVAGNFKLKQANSLVYNISHKEGVLIPPVGNCDSWDLTAIHWVLVIEKEATFRSLIGSSQWDNLGLHGVIMTAKGYPDIASRQFLRQLGDKAPHIPMFVLVDLDPDGIAILSTYKYGSYRLAHEDVTLVNIPTLSLPNIRWLGVKSQDLIQSTEGGEVSEINVVPQLQGPMRLTVRDRKKAAQMLEWDLCGEYGPEQSWRQELQRMLMLNIKAEMQVMDELMPVHVANASLLNPLQATLNNSDGTAKRACNALTCGLEPNSTMSGSPALSNDPRVPFQAPSPFPSSAHPSNSEQHGSSTVESSEVPQQLMPATNNRQSVPLGVFSTLLGSNPTSTQPILSGEAVPAIIVHAQPSDAQEGPSDLTASLSSVPSATTTLTNTLPPTQSAALRALNAPAFHSSPSKSKSAKSTSSRTTVTSQPVVVRTYSGSRHTSRAGSGFNTPRSFPMNGNTHTSALTAGLAGRSEQLPSAEDFSFSAILRAVDPEIRDAIDAIAEICAKSRMSLADEYDSHLPPQGEITGTGPGWAASTGALVGRGRLNRISQGWTAADNTLMAVPEASSSSERLAQEGKTESSKKRSQSAYGSLKSVISGSSGKRKALDGDTFREQEAGSSKQEEAQSRGPPWAVHASSSSSHPAITLAAPTASKHLSLDTSSSAQDSMDFLMHTPATQVGNGTPQGPSSHHRRHTARSLPASRLRAGTLGSLTSWLPWPRPSDLSHDAQQELTKAEDRLREMLMSTQNLGKGKAAAVSVV